MTKIDKWYLDPQLGQYNLIGSKYEGSIALPFPLTEKAIRKAWRRSQCAGISGRVRQCSGVGYILVQDVVLQISREHFTPKERVQKAIDLINSGEIHTWIIRAKMADNKYVQVTE